MDRSIPIKLISQTYAADSLLQQVPTETETTVYAAVNSVSRSEWLAAGQKGLNPEWEIVMFEYDYNGQEIVEFAPPFSSTSQRFSVYRTYKGRDEMVYLYVQRKAGTE